MRVTGFDNQALTYIALNHHAGRMLARRGHYRVSLIQHAPPVYCEMSQHGTRRLRVSHGSLRYYAARVVLQGSQHTTPHRRWIGQVDGVVGHRLRDHDVIADQLRRFLFRIHNFLRTYKLVPNVKMETQVPPVPRYRLNLRKARVPAAEMKHGKGPKEHLELVQLEVDSLPGLIKVKLGELPPSVLPPRHVQLLFVRTPVHLIRQAAHLKLDAKPSIILVDEALEGVDAPARVEVDPDVGLAGHHIEQHDEPVDHPVQVAGLIRGHLHEEANESK